MLNPDDLVSAWVTKLQGMSDLVVILANQAANIQPYQDGLPQSSNLRSQIIDQKSGTILVVFMGTDRVKFGNTGAWSFRHRFSFIVKAPEANTTQAQSGGSYAAIWSAFVNAQPKDSPVSLLNTEIDPACDAMSREGPTASRLSLLISPDGETLDYFEFTATLIEKAA